tara:strand:- start:2381 stop:4228 length:1848 start_codon:yes stop_codon:yes gene_type:complete
MASTPSERLSLRLIGTGDFADTWGAELNSDTLALIDEAVSGVEEISLTGNITLSTTLYQTNQARNRVLRFTDGGLSSAPTIGLPSTERWYVIQNATGGTYALTFNNGSSSVSVAANIDTAIIWQTNNTLYGIDLAKGTDVATVAPEIANNNLQTVAGQISPSNNLGTVAGIASDVTTVSSNAANVTTVAGINSDVTTVAGIASDVSGVNAIASDVTAVNGNSTNINAVNSNATNINAVSSNSANINSVAGIASDVTTVAGISSDVTSVNGISSDVTSVSGISANVTTVAGISANVTTVAGISSDVTGVNAIASDVSGVNAIASDVTGVNSISSAVTAVDSNSSNVNNVSTNIANVNNVGGSITSVNTVANNLTDVNAFGNTYQISTNNPTTDGGGNPLSAGDLSYVTSASKLRVYNGSSWEDAGSATNGTVDRHSYVATANQTTFPATGSISYNPNFVDVYLNGIKLVNGTDVTVSSGSNIVLATGAAVNDTVDVVAYGTFALADMYTKTQSDNRYYQNPAVADLDMGSQSISSGTLRVKNTGSQSQVQWFCEVGNAHYVALQAPPHAQFSGNVVLTLPPNTGTVGQLLQTDGNGVMTWGNAPQGSSIASTLKYA